jgi:tartrate dehydratase beta subunit/fumarate hydratase class I family protein
MADNRAQRKTVRLKLPVRDGDLDDLEIGTVVYLDGVV